MEPSSSRIAQSQERQDSDTSTLRRYLSDLLDEYVVTATREGIGSGWSRTTERWSITTRDYTINLIAKIEKNPSLFPSPIGDEAKWTDRAQKHGIPAPRVMGVEPDGCRGILESRPFMVLEEKTGHVYDPWEPGAEKPVVPAESRDGLASQYLSILSEIHEIPLETSDIAAKHRLKQWVDLATSLSRVPCLLLAVAEWLRTEGPPRSDHISLVHGDFRIDNCAVQRGQIEAIFDWEFAGPGDYHEDLAWIVLPYLGGRFADDFDYLASHMLPANEMLARYRTLSGRHIDRDRLRYYTVFGLFKLLTILHTGLEQYIHGDSESLIHASAAALLPELYREVADAWREGVPL